jgi:enoyl-CoA hydratase
VTDPDPTVPAAIPAGYPAEAAAGTYEAVRFERLGAVLRVTIDHPGSERNAVDAMLHHELRRLMADLRDERDARAVVLTAAGSAFSAGGDFAWFPELRSIEALDALRREARGMLADLLDIEIPVVAAVNGPAVGLGASIALLCDVVVAADTATFVDPHVRVGLVAGDGGTVAWPAALGPARAKWHLLAGEPLPAPEAAALGLVTRCVPPGELQATALAMAERLAANPPLAVRYTKAALNQSLKRALLETVDVALPLELATFLSADHAEAVQAAVEKRPGTYEGR